MDYLPPKLKPLKADLDKITVAMGERCTCQIAQLTLVENEGAMPEDVQDSSEQNRASARFWRRVVFTHLLELSKEMHAMRKKLAGIEAAVIATGNTTTFPSAK